MIFLKVETCCCFTYLQTHLCCNSTFLKTEFFFSTKASILAPDRSRLVLLQMSVAVCTLVRRTGCEKARTAPSSLEDKNVWSCNSTPQYGFILVCLSKHTDNSTLTCIKFLESTWFFLKDAALPNRRIFGDLF